LAAGEIGFETDTLKFKVGNGSSAWTALSYSQDASLLSGTASITALTTSGSVTVGGNLTVNGTTTTLNSSTLQVDDKNIELGSVAAIVGVTGTAVSANTTITASNTAGFIIGQSVTRTAGATMTTGTIASIINATAFTVSSAPSSSGSITFDVGGATDVTADGAGITVKGTTDKTLTWSNATGAWTSNQDFNLSLVTKTYKINAVSVLTETQVLGRSINTASSANTIVARDASNNFAANTITATLFGTANLATSVVGGAAGSLPYQSAANTTAFLARTATNNSTLAFNSSTNAPFWIQPTLSNTYYAATTSAQLAGVVSDETGTGVLVFGTAPTITPANAVAATSATQAGYIGMPQISVSANTAILATHAGKHIYTTTTALTHTIPANSNVAFEIGTAITFVTAPSVSLSIAITTDTLRLANSASTGTRTLAANGVATAIKVTSTAWIMSGNGLT
jgi:hypothetical protein